MCGGAICWYRNVDGSSFATRLVTCPERTGDSAIGTDIDGDGALEVIDTVEGYHYEDIAGLFRRSITQFRSEGVLESDVLDAMDPQVWMAIDWDATVPEGTGLAFQVRSSNDPGDLGAWSEPITSPGSLSQILTPDMRYEQYKVMQSTTDPHVSPIVRDVTLQATDLMSVTGDGPGAVDPAAGDDPAPRSTAARRRRPPPPNRRRRRAAPRSTPRGPGGSAGRGRGRAR
jgi:hypothetical protein